ncbi:MAG: sphingomyelin phosphodiesterase [Chitinophagales bacterium]
MKRFLILFPFLCCGMHATAGDSLKILSWNIFMVPPVIFRSCQQERAVMIGDYIKAQQPDVIILEETFMKKTREIIYTHLKESYPFQSDITKRGLLKSNSGVWILSKFPLLKQDFITYKNKKSGDRFSRKGATFTEINIHGNPVQIIGTHTQSQEKYRTVRELQFQQLKSALADKYFNPAIPQLIIGDLNADYYDTTAYYSMLSIFDASPVHYSGEKYSWDGVNNDLANKFFEHIQQTLDYILLRKEHETSAKINSVEILKPTKDGCFCKKAFFNLSDHHPIVSTVHLQ